MTFYGVHYFFLVTDTNIMMHRKLSLLRRRHMTDTFVIRRMIYYHLLDDITVNLALQKLVHRIRLYLRSKEYLIMISSTTFALTWT